MGDSPATSETDNDLWADNDRIDAETWLRTQPVWEAGDVTLKIGEYSRTIRFLEGQKVEETTKAAADLLAFDYSRWRLKRMAEKVVGE